MCVGHGGDVCRMCFYFSTYLNMGNPRNNEAPTDLFATMALNSNRKSKSHTFSIAGDPRGSFSQDQPKGLNK